MRRSTHMMEIAILFGKDVMIMIGNNESGIEIEGTDAIVENLFNHNRSKPSRCG